MSKLNLVRLKVEIFRRNSLSSPSWNLKLLRTMTNWWCSWVFDNTLVYDSNIFKRTTSTSTQKRITVYNRPSFFDFFEHSPNCWHVGYIFSTLNYAKFASGLSLIFLIFVMGFHNERCCFVLRSFFKNRKNHRWQLSNFTVATCVKKWIHKI